MSEERAAARNDLIWTIVYPLRAFCPSLRTLRADDLFFPLTREMIEETAKTHFDQEDQECDYVEDELDDKDFEHVLNVWQRSGLSIESLLTPMKTDLEDFLYWIDDRDTVDAKTAWYAWRTYCSIANTGRGGKSPGLCLACIKKKQYPEGRPSQRRRCRSHCEG